MTPMHDLRVIVLAEWQTCHLEGVTLSRRDQSLVDSLTKCGDGRVHIVELLSGLQVTARSWVGVLRFTEFEIRIIPKLVGGDLGLIKLVDFASGLDALDRHPSTNQFNPEDCSLFDLIAALLADACERVLRTGLLSTYRELEDALPVIRGRFLIERQVLNRFGKLDKIECRYDEHTTDAIENQILLIGLIVCGSRVRDARTAMRIRRLLAILSESCSVENMDLTSARLLTYDRLNAHYREAHSLSWMILDGLGITDIFSVGSRQIFAFLIDMNVLFEAFVTRWLERLCADGAYRVVAQRRDRSIIWNASQDKSYSAIIPDVLIQKKSALGHLLPFDAKYKLYDDRNLDPSDIYQAFMYAFAYGEMHSDHPSAIILYPTSPNSTGRTHLHIRRAGGAINAEILAIGLDVPAALDQAIKNRPLTAGDCVLAHIDRCLATADSPKHQLAP